MAGASHEAAPSFLMPGPHEERHLAHLTSVAGDPMEIQAHTGQVQGEVALRNEGLQGEGRPSSADVLGMLDTSGQEQAAASTSAGPARCCCSESNGWDCGSDAAVCSHHDSARSLHDEAMIDGDLAKLKDDPVLLGQHLFLGHYQTNGGDKIARISDRFRLWGYDCWRDAEQLQRNPYELVKGVFTSACFGHLITKGSMQRRFCLIEARAAMKLGKPCVVLREDDPRHAGYISFTDAQEQCPPDLRRYIFGDQVWPIGSTPGGLMDEHLYGAQLMKILNQARVKAVSRASSQGMEKLGEVPRGKLEQAMRDGITYVPVEHNGPWPVCAVGCCLASPEHRPCLRFKRPRTDDSEVTVPASHFASNQSTSASSAWAGVHRDPSAVSDASLVCSAGSLDGSTSAALVKVTIYSSGSLPDFDEAKLKKSLSARLGDKIQHANVRVEPVQVSNRSSRRAALRTADSPSPCEIRVQIHEDSYLSSVSTESDSDASLDGELEEAEEAVRKQILKPFGQYVTEDSIKIHWVDKVSSYFVLLEMSFVAARLLCHLATIQDNVLQELAICAVLYDSKCFGSDPLTINKKLAGLPASSPILQHTAFVVPASIGQEVLSLEEFSELEAMYTYASTHFPSTVGTHTI